MTSLYTERIARFRIGGRECLSMLISSGERSRESSGVTMCDSPFRVTDMSVGVEVKSYKEV